MFTYLEYVQNKLGVELGELTFIQLGLMVLFMGIIYVSALALLLQL